MDALRYIQDVTSELITLKVGKYLGKKIEIIILPLDDEVKNVNRKTYKSVKGGLHEYANPSLIEKEKSAWQEKVKKKHALG